MCYVKHTCGGISAGHLWNCLSVLIPLQVCCSNTIYYEHSCWGHQADVIDSVPTNKASTAETVTSDFLRLSYVHVGVHELSTVNAVLEHVMEQEITVHLVTMS